MHINLTFIDQTQAWLRFMPSHLPSLAYIVLPLTSWESRHRLYLSISSWSSVSFHICNSKHPYIEKIYITQYSKSVPNNNEIASSNNMPVLIQNKSTAYGINAHLSRAILLYKSKLAA